MTERTEGGTCHKGKPGRNSVGDWGRVSIGDGSEKGVLVVRRDLPQ